MHKPNKELNLTRTFTLDRVEVRAASDDDSKLIVEGHAAVFEQLSQDLGGFREKIARGAFRKVLSEGPDVRLLINHTGLPLARTTNGTLKLKEDNRGLFMEAELADTTEARDLAKLLERGDVNQMSFGFRVGEDTWEEETTSEGDIRLVRTIKSFDGLFDVSAVTYPAYVQTDMGLRSLFVGGIEIVSEAGEVAGDKLRELAWQIHRGELEATVEERARMDAAFSQLGTVSPWTAEQALRACATDEQLRAVVPGAQVSIPTEDPASGEDQAHQRDLAAKRRSLLRLELGL